MHFVLHFIVLVFDFNYYFHFALHSNYLKIKKKRKNVPKTQWQLSATIQDQCKQIVINKHNLVKNPNWREAHQLAIYRRRREVELGATENNIS